VGQTSNEVVLAAARIPPQEQHVTVNAVQATPRVDGRLRVQGRGMTRAGTGPIAVSSSLMQLEVALPMIFDAPCEQLLLKAVGSGAGVEVYGTGTLKSTVVPGVGLFGLVDLTSVATCAPRP
jgi:hypothetical protein